MSEGGDYEAHVLGEQQALFDIEALPDQVRQKVIDLKTWLEDLETKIGTETLRKAVQYGSADLAVMGHAMNLLLPKPVRSEVMGLQMAIGHYALGKVARIFGAFEQGHSPTHDDWFDLMVYAKMGLKVMETGRWL
jgi:hypothetical protein